MKLAKLSLAAIMAAGAFSVANATPLTDAIKGVNLNGYGYYRFHDASGAEAYSKVEIRVGLTGAVNENVQYYVRATMDRLTKTNAVLGKNSFLVDRAVMTYSGFKYTKVMLGRMYTGSPLDDTDAVGLKVLVSPVDGLTLAGAYFTDNSAVTNALTAVAAIYSNKMFNARAWYVNMDSENSSANNGEDFIFVEGGANVGPVAVKAQYAQANPDASGVPTASTIRLQVSGKAGPVKLRAGYVTNDKDAGNVTIDGSAEGDNDLIYGGIYGLVQINEADESAYFGEVKGSFGAFGVKVGYVSYDNGTYDDQYYGQVDYAVSKKFKTYFRYGSASPVASGADDKTLARFQAQYNF
ncbi:MAG: porin [Campylobacteraceae bacterium]|nr:porin [Campylobacteraceae bacterium]